jgi:hypothetical protein
LCYASVWFCATKESGIITANVFDSTKKALNGVSVQLISMKDSVTFKNTVTDKEGNFTITEIPLVITGYGFPMLVCKP